MSYLRKNNFNDRDEVKSIKFAFYILITLFIFGVLLRSPLSGFFNYLGRSFWSYENSIIKISRNFVSGIFNYSDLSSEIANLNTENIKLKAELKNYIDNGVIITKNGTSTSVLPTSTKVTLKSFSVNDGITAGVLRNPPFSSYDFLLTDKGSSDGVNIDDLVYSESGYLIGEIDSVDKYDSMVKMYSTNGEKINVRIGTSTSMVEATGINDGTYLISLPKGSKVKVGDQVRMPGLKNYIVGDISYVDDDPTKVFQEIFFRYPFSVSGIDKVIIKKSNE